MHGLMHFHRIAALLTAAAALAFFAGSVQAANSRPAGMTKAEYRAQMLRGEALNVRYGLGGAHLVASKLPAVTVAENGFVWGDFAIGAAAMLGVILLAGGLAVAIRRRASDKTSVPSTI